MALLEATEISLSDRGIRTVNGSAAQVFGLTDGPPRIRRQSSWGMERGQVIAHSIEPTSWAVDLGEFCLDRRHSADDVPTGGGGEGGSSVFDRFKLKRCRN